MKRDRKMKQVKFITTTIGILGMLFLEGCSEHGFNGSSNEDTNYEISLDETAYQRARQILEKYPEDVVADDSDSTDAQDAPATEADYDDTVTTQIPEAEATELMEFVDDATIEVLGDSSEKSKPPVVSRVCQKDGMDEKTKKYFENVSDECLLPKMQTASQVFNIRYTFARCIFEQENPHRDRLAHNQNGNGLAQIVNITMKEINKRWTRGDSLAGGLKQCLQYTSNRHDQYLNPIDTLLVPSGYNKGDILAEASSRPASTRLNPLYRDDSVCMGLMTMGIKVQEAKGRKAQRTVSDSELARRYNGSKIQQRYARAVVACVERYKQKGSKVAAK